MVGRNPIGSETRTKQNERLHIYVVSVCIRILLGVAALTKVAQLSMHDTSYIVVGRTVATFIDHDVMTVIRGSDNTQCQ